MKRDSENPASERRPPGRGTTLALCATSAVLYGLVSPGTNWHPLCWILMIPLLEALRGSDPRRGFFVGWILGILIHLVCFYWVAGTVQRYSNLGAGLSLLALVAFSAYSGIAFGAMASLFVYLSRVAFLPTALLFPACYTAMEFLFPFIFPWHVGACLYKVLPLVQMVDLFGVCGLTAFMAAGNVVLWRLLGFLRRRAAFPLGDLLGFSAALLLCLLYGYHSISRIDDLRKHARALDVAVVQANVRIEEMRTPALAGEIWTRYIRLSRQAVREGTDLLVWPESAVNFAYHPGGRPYSSSGFLERLVRSLQTPLLFGSWSLEPDGPRNTAYLLGPDGRLAGRYDKVHLLAFGEYMPFSNWFPWLQGIVQGVGNFRAGTRVEPLQAGSARFGVLICYEAILGGLARQLVGQGAEFLVNITNDAWFGRTRCPEQHLMLASLRAVEERVWLVRAANTGISAFVDPVGRIVRHSGLFQQALLRQRIEALGVPSLYKRWGDWFPLACVTLLALLTLFRLSSGLLARRP